MFTKTKRAAAKLADELIGRGDKIGAQVLDVLEHPGVLRAPGDVRAAEPVGRDVGAVLGAEAGVRLRDLAAEVVRQRGGEDRLPDAPPGRGQSSVRNGVTGSPSADRSPVSPSRCRSVRTSP